jgi:hypothetical protein
VKSQKGVQWFFFQKLIFCVSLLCFVIERESENERKGSSYEIVSEHWTGQGKGVEAGGD